MQKAVIKAQKGIVRQIVYGITSDGRMLLEYLDRFEYTGDRSFRLSASRVAPTYLFFHLLLLYLYSYLIQESVFLSITLRRKTYTSRSASSQLQLPASPHLICLAVTNSNNLLRVANQFLAEKNVASCEKVETQD